jgi:hypothetical protein
MEHLTAKRVLGILPSDIATTQVHGVDVVTPKNLCSRVTALTHLAGDHNALANQLG